MKKPAIYLTLFLCLFYTIKIEAQSVNLSNSLTACYGLDGNGSEPVNSLTATLSAVTPTLDRFNVSNSALSFSGAANSYVQLPNSALIQPTNALTFSSWLKLNSISTNQYIVFTKNAASFNFEAYSLAVVNTGGGTKFRVQKGDGTGSTKSLDATNTVSANVWYHVAFTMDNSTIKIYVNGVLENTTSTTFTFNYQSGKNVILGGSNEASFNIPLDGILDNVKFYNRILNGSEISSLYSTDPTCNSLIAAGLSSSLTACYALNGNGLEAINNLTGTLSIVTPTVDRFNSSNSAIQFTGSTNSYISLPDNPLLKPSTELSFSAWIKAINSLNGYILFTKNSQGTNFEAFNLCIDGSGHFMTRKSGPLGTNQVTSSLTVSSSNWYHVVTIINNTAVKLYVNGILQGTVPSTFNGFDYVNGKNVILGGTNESIYNAPFFGSMDNVRFYNRTLSDAEVNYLYNLDPVCTTSSLAPVSAFSVSSVQVCAGATISYNDISVNAPSAWNWQFSGASSASTSVQNPTVSYNIPGVYITTLTASNANGTGTTYTQAINVSANPTLNISVTNATICAGQSLTLTASGASSYTWNGNSPGINNVQSPVTNTFYNVVGQNSVGCASTASISITVTPNNPIFIATTSGTLCAGQSGFVLASGANTYTWMTGSNASAISVTPNVTTVYSVAGTSTSGCINSATTSIVVYSLPVISVNNGSICAGNSFTINPSGAISYTYSSGTNIVSPTANSNYTVIGLASNSCTNTAVSSVTINALPTLAISNPTGVCLGSSANLTVTGANSYTWNTSSNANIITVAPITNTSYSVIGSNLNGCLNSASVALTINPLPTISVNSGSICLGKSFTIVPSGASTYSYFGGTATVSPLVNTNYTVSGSSLAGCVSALSATAIVTVNSLPTITVNNGTICNGQSFTLSPGGASTYTIGGGSLIVNPLVTTGYTVIGTSTNGCVSGNTPTALITVNALPTITAANGTICSGQVYTINPSGAFSYTYSSGSSIVSPNTNTFYTITGTSSLGCVSAASTTVNLLVNSLPTISVNNGTICSGQSFTLNPSGASSYTFSGGLSIVNPITNTAYTVSGTNSAGCVSANSATANIIVYSLPTITVNSGSICNGQSFTIAANGASSYTIAGGSAIVSPSINTNYTVIGANINGCISANTATSNITVNQRPVITINNGTICSGQPFILNPLGALNYTYSSGSATVNPLTNTSYTIIGSDANGCVAANIVTANITVNPLPTIAVTGGTICNGQSFTIVPSGAQSYTITGGNAVVNPSVNTTYSVTGTNTLGCVSQQAALASITVYALPQINIVNSSSLLCLGESSTLTANGALTYTWSNGVSSNNIVINPTVITTYSLSGLDIYGCINTSSISINPNACLKIQNVNWNAAIRIYPNPSNGLFTIETSGNTAFKFKVYNVLGKQILNDETLENNKTIILTDFPNGFYFLEIVQNKNTFIKKIIKE